MAVFDVIQGGMELSSQALGHPKAKDLRDLVCAQRQKPQLTGALEDLMDGEALAEDEVAAVLHLADGVEPSQVHGATLVLGEFGSEDKGPIIEPLSDDLGTEAVCSRLKGLRVGYGQEGVIILAKTNWGTVQFGLDEMVAVEPVSALKGKEGGHAHRHGAYDLISDIEVVMGEPTSGLAQDVIIGIFGGKFRFATPESRALFHALEDEIDPIAFGTLHAFQIRGNKVLFTNPLFGPLHGDTVAKGIGLDPTLVVPRPAAQDLLGDGLDAKDLSEEVHHVFRSRQHGEVPVDHDTIKTVVDKYDHCGVKFQEGFHRRSPPILLSNKIMGPSPVEVKRNFKYLWLDF